MAGKAVVLEAEGRLARGKKRRIEADPRPLMVHALKREDMPLDLHGLMWTNEWGQMGERVV